MTTEVNLPIPQGVQLLPEIEAEVQDYWHEHGDAWHNFTSSELLDFLIVRHPDIFFRETLPDIQHELGDSDGWNRVDRRRANLAGEENNKGGQFDPKMVEILRVGQEIAGNRPMNAVDIALGILQQGSSTAYYILFRQGEVEELAGKLGRLATPHAA